MSTVIVSGIAGVEGAQQPGIGLDRGGLGAVLAHDQPADAARGVAAGVDLAAVAGYGCA